MDAERLLRVVSVTFPQGGEQSASAFLRTLQRQGVDVGSSLIESVVNAAGGFQARRGEMVVFPRLVEEALREIRCRTRDHAAETQFWEENFGGMKRVDAVSFEREFAKRFLPLYGPEKLLQLLSLIRSLSPDAITFEAFSLFTHSSVRSPSAVCVPQRKIQCAKLLFCTVSKAVKLTVGRTVLEALRKTQKITVPVSPKPGFVRKSSHKTAFELTNSSDKLEDTAKMHIFPSDTVRSRQSTEKTTDRSDVFMRLSAGKRLFRSLFALHSAFFHRETHSAFLRLCEYSTFKRDLLHKQGKMLRKVHRRLAIRSISRRFYYWSAQTSAYLDISSRQLLSFSEEVSVERSKSVCNSVYFLTKQLVRTLQNRVRNSLGLAFAALRRKRERNTSELATILLKARQKCIFFGFFQWKNAITLSKVVENCEEKVEFLQRKVAALLETQCLKRLAEKWTQCQRRKQAGSWRKWRELSLIAKIRRRMTQAREMRADLAEISTRNKQARDKPDLCVSPSSGKVSSQSPSASKSPRSRSNSSQRLKSPLSKPQKPSPIRSKSHCRGFKCDDLGSSIRRIRVSHAGKKLFLLLRKKCKQGIGLKSAFIRWKCRQNRIMAAPKVTISSRRAAVRCSPQARQYSESELRSAIFQLRRLHKS